MNIGERIKQRRKELNLSVDDVAEKLGKNRATIYRYESNDIENLPITILEPLAKILKTTPIYLLGLEDKKQDEGFETPEAAIEFILRQPAIAAYGGFDLSKMSNEEIMDFANELLRQLKLLGFKYKK